MAGVTTSTLSGITTAWDTSFNKIYKETPVIYPAFAMEVSSNTAVLVHAWLDSIPGIREWVGARHIHDVKGVGYSLTNQKWEGTIALKIDDIDDDVTGLYAPRVNMLAYNAKVHPDILFVDLLKNNGLCYDGQNFFDTDHEWRGNTGISNTDNLALDAANLNTVLQKLIENVATTGANNEAPLLFNPQFQIVHGPALRATVQELVKAERNNFGATNINYQIAEPILIPNLTGAYANYWYVLISNAPVKPFIFQKRTDGELISVTDKQNESVFMLDEYKWGWKRRYAAGYGLWQLAFRSTGG